MLPSLEEESATQNPCCNTRPTVLCSEQEETTQSCNVGRPQEVHKGVSGGVCAHMPRQHKVSLQLLLIWLASSHLSGVLSQQGSCSCYCCNGCSRAQLAGSFTVSHHLKPKMFFRLSCVGRLQVLRRFSKPSTARLLIIRSIDEKTQELRLCNIVKSLSAGQKQLSYRRS